MSKCVFCQNEVEIIGRVGRRDECITCGRPLHCCLQCKYYDEKAFHECLERVEYRIEHKDRENYCEMFSFGREATEKVANKDKIRSDLDALFKK